MWVTGLSFPWDFDGKVLKPEDLRTETGFSAIVRLVLEFFVFLFFEPNPFGVASEVLQVPIELSFEFLKFHK